MSVSWRPNGWFCPRLADPLAAYEAGADKILEAQKAEGIYIKGAETTADDNIVKLDMPNIPCWVIIIPDKEAK